MPNKYKSWGNTPGQTVRRLPKGRKVVIRQGETLVTVRLRDIPSLIIVLLTIGV